LRVWTRGVDRTVFNSTHRGETVAGRPVLLSVGRVSVEKGLDDFCQLDISNATKVIVGNGPYRAELEKKYPTVLFAGAKFGYDLAEYYANADVFVFTSRVDTFGIVIIESLSCGTPVAAYPVPGPVDIIENGVNGCMSSDLNHAIEQCLSMDRKQVFESSQKWTWENCWQIFHDNLVPSKF